MSCYHCVKNFLPCNLLFEFIADQLRNDLRWSERELKEYLQVYRAHRLVLVSELLPDPMTTAVDAFDEGAPALSHVLPTVCQHLCQHVGSSSSATGTFRR
jgi:hypothetical protein